MRWQTICMECLHLLCGMRKSRNCSALRDQFGTKPFYYYETEDGELLYGTMIRDIMEQPGFEKELNEEMLQLYLTSDLCGRREYIFPWAEKTDAGTLSDLEERNSLRSPDTGNRNFIRMRARLWKTGQMRFILLLTEYHAGSEDRG